jgi:uncharacterized repeat protein (TIGR03847 family)
MADDIELEHIDALAAGAVGEPGQREFYIQARTESTQLTVLVEKEQVALLAAEAVTFLDRIADDFPEEGEEAPKEGLREPTVPLFRARLIGLGFDPERQRVLIELRERADNDDEEEGLEGERPAGERASAGGVTPPAASEPIEEEGFVARIYATRSQVRAMAARGAAAVAAGRPPCPLCDMPMDPAGHRCPRWN